MVVFTPYKADEGVLAFKSVEFLLVESQISRFLAFRMTFENFQILN